ncbi:hypothetical protein ACMC9I_09145 [Deinococcota bacterium DY0809b]
MLLILLFAPAVCALDPAAQLRAGYPDLLKALAADGVHLDLARARLDRLPSDRELAWVRVPETRASAKRPWAVALELEFENGRLANPRVMLKASSEEAFPYGIWAVSWSLDGVVRGANAIVMNAPPGANEAYDRAGARIFRDRLPATYAYLQSLENRRAQRTGWALGVTLLFGLGLVFFAVTQPRALCRWTACDGRWNAQTAVSMGIVLAMILWVNSPFATEAFFELDLFLVWAMVAASATAALALNAPSRDLDHFLRGLVILTALGLAAAETLNVLGTARINIYAFVMGYLVGMTPLSLGLQKGWLRPSAGQATKAPNPAGPKTAAPPPPEAGPR